MSRRLWLSIAALTGTALIFYAVPRAHPAAQWNVESDRAQSLLKAREISAALGVDTSTWASVVSGETAGRRGYYLEKHPSDAAAKRFTPIYPKVAFKAPDGSGRVAVELSSAGQVNSWEQRGYGKPAAGDRDQARRVAQVALYRMAGSSATGFHSVTDAAPSGKNLLFAWEQNGGFTQRFEATVEGGTLVKAELKPVYTRDIDDARDAQRHVRSIFEIAGIVLPYFVGLVVSACIYIFWAARRAVRHRCVFELTAVAVAWGIIRWFNWSMNDQRQSAWSSGEGSLGVWLSGAGLLFALVLMYLVLTGAMNAVAPGAKLATLRSLFTASGFNRQAGRSILAGLAAGPLIVGIPMLLASFAFLHSQPMGDYDAGLIYSSEPGIYAISVFPPDAVLIGLFGVGAGILLRFIKNRKVGLAILFGIGALVLVDRSYPSNASPAVFLSGASALFVIYALLFFRIDMLATLTAAWCASVIFNSASLFLQPARSLHVNGITALGYLAAVVVVGLVMSARGRELNVDESPSSDFGSKSQREAIMAEFSIAHRVQQQMLPEHPPEIPGYSIAASCQPAREVGGDLFDFLKLPDGRWSISVGDVSGKGVPAALYMTLTKGLLMATTQETGDITEIISNVNGHMHEVTERKTFVTMAMGALDPETGRFDHVRAGHNPIVWRRAANNETRFLTAPGIGLGMVSDRLFRRSIRSEYVELDSGDVLVFYSDGLTEAMNRENEQFGDDRLLATVQDADSPDAAGIHEHILSRVAGFLDGIAPQDDLTIVVLRVN